MQDFGAKRVDYHGARLHCVVVEPEDNEGERILRAIALAEQLQILVISSAQEIARLDFSPELAVGIDSGLCVAINNGRGHEREPLFLGAAANYSAKLAEADSPGIYLSSGVRAKIGLSPLIGGLKEERSYSVGGQFATIRATALTKGTTVSDSLADSSFRVGRVLADWSEEIRASPVDFISPDSFRFHSHTPPLKTIDYGELSPGNSIRMPLVSIFADLDGYTKFIDNAVGTGNVHEAVRALHVIRGEFHQVLKSDFQGRKVRYVGDCIHGVIAFGTSSRIDEAQSVTEGIKCAVGMSESLDIIKDRLPSLSGVGLASGVEIGPTPISRIGIRGDRSVRVATSTATIQSQRLQETIDDVGVLIGPEALKHLSYRAQAYFSGGYRQRPEYDDLSYLFGVAAPALAASAATSEEFRPHQEFRPHSSTCTRTLT